MILVRPSGQRGVTKLDWLDSRHTFSFGDYHDPAQMGFRVLRVINDDRVKAGAGFGSHAHQDMEILTFVLEGALAHTDSLGTGSTILPGDLQRMSAGTGIVHSEFNQSKTVAVHFLQIWVLPRQRGLPAGYEQKSFDVQRRSGKLCRIASGALRDGAVGLQQDLELFTTILGPGQTVTAELRPGRFGWLQVARGALSANGTALAEGDGAALVDITTLELRGSSACEALLFDLP